MFTHEDRDAALAFFNKKMGINTSHSVMLEGESRNSSGPFDKNECPQEAMLVSTITVPVAPVGPDVSKVLEDTSRLEVTCHVFNAQHDADLKASVLTAEAFAMAKAAKEARIAARILELGGEDKYKQNMQSIAQYWEDFFRTSPAVNGTRYQFMFPEDIVPEDWDSIRTLHVRNQWLSVQKYVRTNAVLAELVKHMGLREFKTLLTGHSFSLITRRLQRLMVQTLRTLEDTKLEVTKPEDTSPDKAELMQIIKDQRDDIRSLKLKLRINHPITPYSDAKAVVDWVNNPDAELALLKSEDTSGKQVSSRHDAERDVVISGMRKEGKTQREIAEALGIQQKSVARACKRMGV